MTNWARAIAMVAALGAWSGQTGTLTYTVDGVSVTKQIQRLVFGSPQTQCY